MSKYNFNLKLAETDSVFFYKPDGSKFTPEESKQILDDINSLLPELLNVESDGILETCILIKRKNYIKRDADGKLTFKGSSLKSANKEQFSKTFMKDIIAILLDFGLDYPKMIARYEQEIIAVNNIQDIKPYTTKKSISKKILKAERTTELKIFEAVKHLNPREGDKFYVYFKSTEDPYAKDCPLAEKESWKPGDENPVKLMQRVYDTMNIFCKFIDISQFPKYHLKSNLNLLQKLLGQPITEKVKKGKKSSKS